MILLSMEGCERQEGAVNAPAGGSMLLRVNQQATPSQCSEAWHAAQVWHMDTLEFPKCGVFAPVVAWELTLPLEREVEPGTPW